MPRLPLVAIVGRPNVGKSSLLNRIAGRRISIVEPTAGVTRDRVSTRVEHEDGRAFELVDTGGLGLVDELGLEKQVEAQIDVALANADLIVFVVDGKEGFVPGDQLVARHLRRLAGKTGRPVVLAVNKVESHLEELGVGEWTRLGFGEPMPVSAKEGFGIADLIERVFEVVPEAAAEPEVSGLKIAIVGKRNSGKSTLVNHLVGEERVIVSEIPGTTRDAVDVPFEHGGRTFVAIDTAGARKKSSLQDAIELFSYTRATDSIRRADVVLHMFDVRETISQVDKKLAGYTAEQFKPVILVGNKIDLADDLDTEAWDAYIRQQLSGLDHAPVVFTSALHGDQVEALLDLCVDIDEQNAAEIPTRALNDLLLEARERLTPRVGKSKAGKIYYATQIRTRPATILAFVNDPRAFHGPYERFLQNSIRERFEIEEVPIRILFRARKRAARRAPGASGAPGAGAALADDEWLDDAIEADDGAPPGAGGMPEVAGDRDLDRDLDDDLPE